jgi:hypothetical protein
MRTALLFLTLAFALHGQSATGALFGEIRDESGARVAAVQVIAQQESTGFTRVTLSDESGAYRIEPVAPGGYTVKAQRPGFRTAVASHAVVEVNQQARVDLVLKIGESRDRVEVRAAVPPFETEDSAQGSRLDSASITQLPLDERNVVSLLTLGPGAIPRQLGGFVHDADNDVQQGSRGSVALNPAVNGARPSMNAFLLDGAYNTDQNVFAPVVIPPMDSVQEFRTQSSLSPVPFAQAGGGLMDIVTKSGGKEYHGSAFEYLRNEATDARNYFDDPGLPREIFRRNQFGGSLGGRLPLPSTFFYGAYEGLRGKAATPSVQLTPDAQLRAGNFLKGNTIYDPLSGPTADTRAPFAGNLIPDGRIDSVARNYLARFEPLPNRSPNSLGNYLDTTPGTSDHDSASARIDHQFRAGNVLFGRYTINDDRGGVASGFPLRPTNENLRAQQIALGHTMAGASWSNELRASFTRLRLFDIPQSASLQQNVAASLGIANPPSDPQSFGLPYFFLADFSTLTDDPTLPQIQRDNTWSLSETYSRVHGRRTLKFGFNLSRFQLNYRQSNNIRGQYTYSGAFTGNGTDPASGDALADFLLGFPQSATRTFGDSQAYLRRTTFGGFAQQDWQVTRRLAVNLGLRYEYLSPFTDARDQMLNLDYSKIPQSPTLVSTRRAYNPNRLDFAPRAGLAWSLPGFFGAHGETVLRAGYGIYFNPEIALESYSLVLNNLRTELNAADGTVSPTLTTRDAFAASATAGFPSYYGVDRTLPTPSVQQWNAGIQRELPGAVLLDVSYIGAKGTHLGRSRRFNTALHTETGENLGPRPGDLQSLRAFPDLGTLFQYQNIANSAYNSLQLRAEKRLRKSLMFLASFVWSKSIDDSSSVIPSLFDSGGAQNENNLRLERGLSVFNVGRRLSGGFVYSLPAPRSYRGLLSGWQVSGVVTVQDGTPLDPLYISMDTANAGTFTRPDIVPGQSISLPRDQRTPEHWFNTDAFAAPAPFQFGNAGRDIIPGPGNEVVDLALHKRFTLSERTGVEFRAESFNLLNHPNLGFPDPYPDQGPFFGRILTTGQPRRLQFAVRVDF